MFAMRHATARLEEIGGHWELANGAMLGGAKANAYLPWDMDVDLATDLTNKQITDLTRHMDSLGYACSSNNVGVKDTTVWITLKPGKVVKGSAMTRFNQLLVPTPRYQGKATAALYGKERNFFNHEHHQRDGGKPFGCTKELKGCKGKACLPSWGAKSSWDSAVVGACARTQTIGGSQFGFREAMWDTVALEARFNRAWGLTDADWTGILQDILPASTIAEGLTLMKKQLSK
jgi:hypothetical protein